MIIRQSIAIQIRSEYEAARSDTENTKKWFNKYNYLSLADLAQALQINRSHLYRLRKKCGLVEPTDRRVIKTKEYDQGPIAVPEEGWRNQSWFMMAYKKYGYKRLAVALNLSSTRTVIIKMNYAPNYRQEHPCDTRSWCYHNYIIRDQTQDQCAKLAKISVATFNQWLCKHNIDRKIYKNYAVPLYIKELAKNLLEQPVVTKVRFRNGYLKVHYTSRTAEGYFYTVKRMRNYPKAYRIYPPDTEIKDDYKFQYVYGTGLQGENEFKSQIRLNKNFDNLTFMDQRLAIHSFLAEMHKNDWTQLRHPPEELVKDWERCLNIKYEKYVDVENGSIRTHISHGSVAAPGHVIAEHFFRNTYGHKVFCQRFNHARYMIMKALLRSKTDITITDFMKFIGYNRSDITKRYFGHRIKFYKDFGSAFAILKKFNFGKTMLDLSPGYGYNALAAAVAGIEYKYLKDDKIGNIINNGFADFVSLKHGVFNGEQVDVLFYHNYYFPKMSVIREYYKYAKRIVVYVPYSDHRLWLSQYKPEIVMKYYKDGRTDKHDFLMIW